MLSKLSNTATKGDIEEKLNATFDYDYLYQPMQIINGKKETTLCIVTDDAPGRIQFGIWGILPKKYMGSWKKFQEVHNTLEVCCKSVPENSWLFEPLNQRRCLIIVTGYYSEEITDDKLQSVKTRLKDKSVFCIAGIYNTLDDGFITCSILSRLTTTSLHQLNKPQPVIIAPENYEAYLAGSHLEIGTCATSLEIDASLLEHVVLDKNHLFLA